MPARVKAAVAVLASSVLVSGLYVLNLLFTEGVSSSKHSISYWVTISSGSIRGFPVLEAASEPIYYYSSADGPSPSIQEVSYVSSLDRSTLTNRIGDFMRERGFRNEAGRFVTGSEEITVTLDETSAGLTEVRAYRVGLNGRF